ncbi:MAG: Asp-tRNA(Asn)/Glu-tRNA(Gln) amidotransferase subunit GatA [bacterium]|nr:Asp-tRNA(Asn)/Glu-tRNA(Gln) amidotransferase subunit GatA [bacterium]
MSINLSELTIATARRHLANGDFTAVELAQSYLAEIEKKNKNLNAYREVFDDVLEQAKGADKKLPNFRTSKLPNLCGIPIALKDVIMLAGKRAGACSKILEGYVSPYDATAVSKLKVAGAIFLGRTNMDEFAMGSSTENYAYGVTKNPFDESRVAGGSSGGSAAAVAGNMSLAALGSDTGGSVRQPASLCGVVGLKPTYGSVSRFGLMAMSSSLDVIGPFTKTVEDAELLFDAIKGKDPMDSTSVEVSSSKLQVKSLRIGIPTMIRETEGIDPDVRKNFEDCLKQFRDAGHTVKEIELPTMHYALPVYYVIMPAEVSTNLARFDGVKYGLHVSGKNLLEDYVQTRGTGFGMEARRRILLGTYVLSSGYYDAYYAQAVRVRAKIEQELRDVFAGVDCIATPTSPTPAFKIGEKADDPLQMYLADIFTVVANIAGIPAISIPSGTAMREGKQLPLGLQLMAAHGREDVLFEAGKEFEKLRDNRGGV